MQVPEVSPQVAKQALDEGAIMLDVREGHEFAQARVPGSRHVPLGRISMDTQDLKPGKLVLVLCAHGNRSAVACQMLQARGLEVANVRGGISAWWQAGLPVDDRPGR